MNRIRISLFASLLIVLAWFSWAGAQQNQNNFNTSGSGSGTVNSGTSGQLAYYASSTAAVSGSPAISESGNNVTITGLLASYNGVSTAGNGVAPIVAKMDQTAQAANFGPSTVYTVPSSGAGTYLVSCYVVLTQAATTSSTLPFCAVNWTDLDTSTVKSGNANELTSGSITGNNVGATGTTGGWLGVMTIQAAASSTIQIQTAGYVSSGATPMQYAAHVKVQYLGN
jgi:hypothetical protein